MRGKLKSIGEPVATVCLRYREQESNATTKGYRTTGVRTRDEGEREGALEDIRTSPALYILPLFRLRWRGADNAGSNRIWQEPVASTTLATEKLTRLRRCLSAFRG